MKERWVTFDCFGTLVDWNGGFRGNLERLAGDRVDALLEAFHQHERLVEASTPHVNYREVLAAALTRAAEQCGISCSDVEAAMIGDCWDILRPFDDVEATLASLRQAGFRLGVLTNCDDDLFELTHGHFRERFDLVVTAESVMDYKLSLSHFRRFQRITGVAPGHWIHAACSWFHDMGPAAKLGIPSVWVDRDRTGDDPSIVSIRIESAAQLCDAVRRLSADDAESGAESLFRLEELNEGRPSASQLPTVLFRSSWISEIVCRSRLPYFLEHERLEHEGTDQIFHG